MNWKERMREVLAFRDQREWAQFHNPKELVSGLGIEVSELAELFLWKTPSELEHELESEAFRGRVADELADIQVFVMYLVERLGLDLDRAIIDKLRKNDEKYPADKARGVATKYTDL